MKAEKAADAIEQKLDAMFNKYDETINKKAQEIFEKHVKPILVRRGWSFTAGMGTCVVRDNEGVVEYDHSYYNADDKDMQKLELILNMAVPGYEANCLGSFMPNYEHV